MSVERIIYATVRLRGLVYLTWTTLFVSAGIPKGERGSTRPAGLPTSCKQDLGTELRPWPHWPDQTVLMLLRNEFEVTCISLNDVNSLQSGGLSATRCAYPKDTRSRRVVCLEQTSKKRSRCFDVCSSPDQRVFRCLVNAPCCARGLVEPSGIEPLTS